jgi:hypothetical protein
MDPMTYVLLTDGLVLQLWTLSTTLDNFTVSQLPFIALKEHEWKPASAHHRRDFGRCIQAIE